MRILFSTSVDSYVAVIHIDPDGNLDFLYPETPFDREYVRGGQVYPVGRGGFTSGRLVRGSGGIGYLYVIASPIPLDYRYFRGRPGYGWDWSYAGRGVQGDPFWALEQVTRMLLPDWDYVPYAVDYFSYYVEGRPRYPSYVCSGWSGRDRGGWGYSPYLDSCDRLDGFLRQHPYYFDARRYRGDRRALFRDFGSDDPRHGYKESPDDDRWRSPAVGRPSPQLGPRARVPIDGREEQEAAQEDPRVDVPSRRRPTLERRPTEPAPAQGATRRSGPTVRTAPAARPNRSGGGGQGSERAAPARRRPGGGT